MNHKNKGIAVLIPTFKPQDYFKACISSLDNQTLSKDKYKVYICLNGERTPYEFFIFDILSSISFKYEFIYTEQYGVSNARNNLLGFSNEDYIVFLDDDDVISSNYLEELSRVTDEEAMGISNIFNFEKGVSQKKPNYIGITFDRIADCERSKLKTRKYFSSPCAKMLHRKMIGRHRFDPNVTKGEDSLFMAKISSKVNFVRKTQADACYLVNERNGSVTRRKSSIKLEVKTLNYLFVLYVKMLFHPDYEKIFIFTRLLATTVKYFKLLRR